MFLAAIALGVALWGCAAATIPGPQFRRVPSGLSLSIFADRTPTLLPRHEVLDRRGYTSREGDESRPPVRITTLAGAADHEEILTAWTHVLESTEEDDVGPVETLRIRKRPAWGWRRIRKEDERSAGWFYTAVLPDAERDRTYLLEFQDPARAWSESELRAVLASFTPQRGGPSSSRIGLALALIAGFAFVLKKARGGLL